MYFRREVTELTWQHEVWHLVDLQRLGSKKFYETPNWKLEEMVWDRIWRTKEKWTENELVDSYRYFRKEAETQNAKDAIIKVEMESLLREPYYKFIRYKN